MWREQIFAFGIQSVGSTLGGEVDGRILLSNNRCRNSFLIARAESFSLRISRMKNRPRRPPIATRFPDSFSSLDGEETTPAGRVRRQTEPYG